jgi:hypothetical protein
MPWVLLLLLLLLLKMAVEAVISSSAPRGGRAGGRLWEGDWGDGAGSYWSSVCVWCLMLLYMNQASRYSAQAPRQAECMSRARMRAQGPRTLARICWNELEARLIDIHIAERDGRLPASQSIASRGSTINRTHSFFRLGEQRVEPDSGHLQCPALDEQPCLRVA